MVLDQIPRLVHFAICDDIRKEERGKITLVGFYGRSMRIGKFPGALPKLCFLAQFELFTQPTTLTLRVISPSGEVLLDAENIKMAIADPSIPIPLEYRYSQLIFQIAPMPFKEQGRYRVAFSFPNGTTYESDFYVIADPSLMHNAQPEIEKK